MSEQSAGEAAPKKKRWGVRILLVVVTFFVSIGVSKAFEIASAPQLLADAELAQKQWINAVSSTSPVAVVSTYWVELNGAWWGESSEGAWSAFEANGKGKGIVTPVYALVMTGARFFYEGGAPIMIQLALGALGVAVFNFLRSKGQTILFDNELTTLLFGPIAVILAASVIGMILWLLMLGGLMLLGEFTKFAGWAAGATGVVGFGLYCFSELGKKGVEHVLTSKLKA